MAVALTTVVLTTRSILLRDVTERTGRLLSQETSEFGSFVEHEVDPATGAPFTDARRLLTAFLERQYPDTDEELLGLVREEPRPVLIRQPREVPAPLPLHEDPAALERIAEAPGRTGTLRRASGEIRWAKVPIAPARSGDAEAAFIVALHADRALGQAEDVVRLLVAISGVALLMTCAGGWVVAGRILAPVRLVRATAAQLTELDLTRRIPLRGRDDIQALAETFNAMLDRLERAFAAQRRFVDDAGHELRTPITIVRGHLELMSQDADAGGAAERRETVRLVTEELDRMSRLVEDLLLLANAERPGFVDPGPVQLAELTADVFVKARALGERRWELPEAAGCEIRADAQRITQAMVQLAQNAVQHTGPGARVRIGSRLVTPPGGGPPLAELYVADGGPGVPPGEAELIFERFRRGSASRRGGGLGGGGGLGLSIVRAIAEGHRGRVDLRPTPGGGATFVLVLPTQPPLPSPQEAPQ
ncbi:HAMP domain-containing sensor histidine kinase [Streptomyces sp. DSM 44917]|uniref:histidine kinase n=1 Tax=Streptomyces boetiae TaxID=3075541 RepID=A0ABU2L5H0_9ACTN|nr:HAMP domain-containing sensor histidine kinase [Streptomyces sp. DSM 44917]MDT0306816.1 HAMP domain-containing sensor histidine kinase [Streptomyces sp. DSM 44917]